jgi:hypothetical protein
MALSMHVEMSCGAIADSASACLGRRCSRAARGPHHDETPKPCLRLAKRLSGAEIPNLPSRSCFCARPAATPRLCQRRARCSKPEPMVKRADEPECIHREPQQREHAGKPYFTSSQRRARSYAKHPVFKAAGARGCSRSQALMGCGRFEQCSDLSTSICH